MEVYTFKTLATKLFTAYFNTVIICEQKKLCC